ncbi:MAG: GntR family transcriptional regulator [Acidobacteriota bacterium]|nr:GntR family transcriptional regulator [Acidobacteriota bacterium]
MDLPVSLNKTSGVPIYVQLEQQIRLLIRSGRLKAGDPMPTVRELAVDLAINYNTVARVYRDLQREGALSLKRGIGTFISEQAAVSPLPAKNLSSLEEKARELIDLAQEAGFTREQLQRFLDMKWKEAAHER